ncbi:dsRBD fold-containing protein [Streptacidiphilus anmyonensis]|uniref:dsRBD fold-containing protein n=1 Tax=Streptacidiphilus anmyonensis TaxID=405782 RepID=UPI00128CBD8D|nr:dsRBD fold-containing protein [Streptacidiphilus anmyonensis]
MECAPVTVGAEEASIPEIGDEYAAGRALLELGRQLLRAGETDAASEGDGRFG